jgi:hypothetical protein
MGASYSQFGQIQTSVYKKTEESRVRYGYYKNSKDVYYNGISLKLNKRERRTFKKLKYSYAKTRTFVFYEGVVIPDADPKTFITINRKNMPDEFVALNSVIGMDFLNGQRRIYQFGKLLPFR